MSIVCLAVAIYQVQAAMNAYLRAKYPAGQGPGLIPGELIAAAAGLLLVGTLAIEGPPSLPSLTVYTAGATPTTRPSVAPPFQPTALPTIAPTVPPGPVEGTGVLSLTSERGDYIGLGRSMTVASTSWRFRATYFSPDSISIMADSGTTLWTVALAAPRGQPLLAGTYNSAERSAFRSGSAPGIDVYGDGRGCNQVSGSFTVTTATIGSGGQVAVFEATFEEHCEGRSAPALRGTIRFDASAAR